MSIKKSIVVVCATMGFLLTYANATVGGSLSETIRSTDTTLVALGDRSVVDVQYIVAVTFVPEEDGKGEVFIIFQDVPTPIVYRSCTEKMYQDVISTWLLLRYDSRRMRKSRN